VCERPERWWAGFQGAAAGPRAIDDVARFYAVRNVPPSAGDETFLGAGPHRNAQKSGVGDKLQPFFKGMSAEEGRCCGPDAKNPPSTIVAPKAQVIIFDR